jgi:hypothetical protein
MMPNPEWPDPLTIACPRCAAAVGVKCTTKQGGPCNPHTGRVFGAKGLHIQDNWRAHPPKPPKPPKVYKVLNPGYVWCDKVGGIHDNTLNPYGYIDDGRQDYCKPDEHRAVFVESEDPNEEF